MNKVRKSVTYIDLELANIIFSAKSNAADKSYSTRPVTTERHAVLTQARRFVSLINAAAAAAALLFSTEQQEAALRSKTSAPGRTTSIQSQSTLPFVGKHLSLVVAIHCVSKNRTLRLIWHNFASSQHLLIIFGRERDVIQISIDYSKKFISIWLRTSCVISITTVETWHTWIADFLVDFEERIIDRAMSGKTIMGLCQGRMTAVWTLVLTSDTAHCSDRNTVYLQCGPTDGDLFPILK